MTAIMADEDSGVEMAQVRTENGKITISIFIFL